MDKVKRFGNRVKGFSLIESLVMIGLMVGLLASQGGYLYHAYRLHQLISLSDEIYNLLLQTKYETVARHAIELYKSNLLLYNVLEGGVLKCIVVRHKARGDQINCKSNIRNVYYLKIDPKFNVRLSNSTDHGRKIISFGTDNYITASTNRYMLSLNGSEDLLISIYLSRHGRLRRCHQKITEEDVCE